MKLVLGRSALLLIVCTMGCSRYVAKHVEDFLGRAGDREVFVKDLVGDEVWNVFQGGVVALLQTFGPCARHGSRGGRSASARSDRPERLPSCSDDRLNAALDQAQPTRMDHFVRKL